MYFNYYQLILFKDEKLILTDGVLPKKHIETVLNSFQ